jgi:hypothetical protein
MKDLVLEALRESVKRYPDLFEYIDGAAAWVIIRDDLLLWQAKAVTQIRNGEPALCDFESAVIPESIADLVRDYLAFADCEDCVKTAFSDVEAFMKAPGSKSKHEKIPAYTGDKPFIPTQFKDITEAEINRALKVWDNTMPGYEGMLDARVKRESEEDNAG